MHASDVVNAFVHCYYSYYSAIAAEIANFVSGLGLARYYGFICIERIRLIPKFSYDLIKSFKCLVEYTQFTNLLLGSQDMAGLLERIIYSWTR